MSFAVCETIYHEDEVDDDVANCVTEMICKDDEDCEDDVCGNGGDMMKSLKRTQFCLVVHNNYIYQQR